MTTPAVLPQTIGQVIEHLDHAIERCIRERSRLGYFATLYRNVTARVRDEIAAAHHPPAHPPGNERSHQS